MTAGPGCVAQDAASAREAELAPVLAAGLLLAVRASQAEYGFSRPRAAEVIQSTGVSRARAYEVRSEVLELLPSLLRPVGRPRRTPSGAPPASLQDVSVAVIRYLAARPGAMRAGPSRRHYTDDFRRFILELRARYEEHEHADFARAVHVPAKTLDDWLRSSEVEAPSPASGEAHATEDTSGPEVTLPPESARLERVQTILRAWEGWSGSFVAFCRHVEEHLRVPYKRTLIANLLEQHGLRPPRRRSGRSPDERALRAQFQTFFPGAQWSADGTPLTVEVGGECFTFNLELVVDPASGAFVGLSIRDEEDGKAVVEAFEDAVQATGEPPLALLLDNRPSNHTEEVDEALGETLRMRSTSGRPQNKAHSEGAFGLLAQTSPPLSLPSLRPYDLARELLNGVVTTWARTLNHRPRADREGQSRAELYAVCDPTPEQVEEARRALEELVRKQERARLTLEARQDPVVRKTLDEAFARLGLDDPERHQRLAIGRYPLEHVVAGVAVFEGKRAAGTLPDGVDARYLLGIVRNLALEDEGLEIAEALWRGRLAARDEILLGLDREREQALAGARDALDLTCRLADRAIDSARALDRSFWLRALADAIDAQPEEERRALFRTAARRIHATYAVAHKQRLTVVRRLSAMLLPLA